MEKNKVHLGNCSGLAKQLETESIHCMISSPPYWGLRDYQTGKWHGGDPDCDHVESEIRTGLGMAALGEKYKGGGHKQGRVSKLQYATTCAKCGAIREDEQIGREDTLEQYIETLVGLFRELRRALRKDGVLWLNLGDSYANVGKWGGSTGGKHANGLHGNTGVGRNKTNYGNLKPKDLTAQPWRVALALQADGWYLRSAIPWVRQNPMPESVQDRLTNAHEYIFLLTKSARYYYDPDPLRRPIKTESISRLMRGVSAAHKNIDGAPGQTPHSMNQPRDNRNKATTFKRNGSKREQVIPNQTVGTHRPDRDDTDYNPAGRNGHTTDFFWDSLDQYIGYLQHVRDNGGMLLNEIGDPVAMLVNTRPYSGAHFAVFPPDLVTPLIQAGTSEHGCCAKCGAPWKRVIEKGLTAHDGETNSQYQNGTTANRLAKLRQAARERGEEYVNKQVTTGWQPTCKCDTTETIPPVVLDPFMGSGTVAQVAIELGRDYIGFELNEDYMPLINERLHGTQKQLIW
jgi:DNA modification methylase